MNKRRAKREACTIAHKLITSYLDRDYGPDELPDEAVMEKIDAALLELSEEMHRRGMNDADGDLT
jgi:hypothetical protein